MTKLKVAIVIPTIVTIGGNRTAFLLAKSLVDWFDVSLICYHISSELIEKVESLISPAHLKYKYEIDGGSWSTLKSLRYQFVRGRDRSLAKFIEDFDKQDFLLVISNEGKWLPNYLKRHNKHIITAISVMELNDNFFYFPYYEEIKMRFLWHIFLFPIYGILRFFEKERYQSFDLLFANSLWTELIFQYLYQLTVKDTIILLDSDFWKPPLELKDDERYIAVPTASLSGYRNAQEIIRNLVKEGLNLISYGPHKIEGVPYLGFLDDESLVKFIGNACGTLFLFDYEALGLIPFESLLCGTPVITFKKQGPFTELKSNDNIYFVTEYRDIRKACLDLLHAGKTKSRVVSCRNSVESYSAHKVAPRIAELIKNELLQKITT